MTDEGHNSKSRGSCPHCGGDPISSLACLACGTVLAERDDANHFTRLGLPPVEPFDADAAEGRYLKLSRLLHPDFQTQADQPTRDRALRHSALLNEAWRVLNDAQLRSEYMLELRDPGALERHKTLSPAFLMEAMDLSEELEEAHASGCEVTLARIQQMARAAVEERMHGVASACGRTIERIVHQDDPPPHPAPPHEWNTEQIATMLHQARVYRRILRDTEASKT